MAKSSMSLLFPWLFPLCFSDTEFRTSSKLRNFSTTIYFCTRIYSYKQKVKCEIKKNPRVWVTGKLRPIHLPTLLDLWIILLNETFHMLNVYYSALSFIAEGFATPYPALWLLQLLSTSTQETNSDLASELTVCMTFLFKIIQKNEKCTKTRFVIASLIYISKHISKCKIQWGWEWSAVIRKWD